MKILADSRWCGLHGIGRFASEVLPRLGTFSAVPASVPLLHPVEPLWLSWIVKRARPSVYFSPGFNPPIYSSCPTVFVLHDLIHLRVEAEVSPAKRLYYERVVRPAMARAARVLTVSEASRQDLMEWSGAGADKIVVVGNGVSQAFRQHGVARRSSWPYFLFVGNIKPHKNLGRVLAAFARSGQCSNFRLALVGHPDKRTMRTAAELRIGHALEFLGSMTDSDLASCYRGAAALVAPSLHEGFCLPALEAMACGCPVIAARGNAQKEVIGPEGLFVDPLSVDDIASAMKEILEPGRRQSLIAHGLRRAQLYSWDKTAAMVRIALDEAVQSDRSHQYAEALA